MYAFYHQPAPIPRGFNRHQTFFSTLEEHVAADNPVRLIDDFIDKLDLAKMGFTKTLQKSEGNVWVTAVD